MRFVIVALVVLYLVLAFIGCLDRQMMVHNAGGKEIQALAPRRGGCLAE